MECVRGSRDRPQVTSHYSHAHVLRVLTGALDRAHLQVVGSIFCWMRALCVSSATTATSDVRLWKRASHRESAHGSDRQGETGKTRA